MARSHLPSRHSLLNDAAMLVVYRDPFVPPKPAPGQPGTHSDFVPTEPELFIAVLDDGHVMAFNGHVDLGTGIRTALAQIVAEELDVRLTNVTMVLGHPSEVPNQGPTIASATIQITAEPLRRAAAQARHHLVALAAAHFGRPVERLASEDGGIRPVDDPSAAIGYGALLGKRRHALKLKDAVALKPASDYRIVGSRAPRVDIPAKATGELTFVHDLRLPGMLHGRVIRPPYIGHDRGEFIGRSLIEVDRRSVADIAGVVEVVTIGDFVGIVAEREEAAIQAAQRLKVTWREPEGLPDVTDLEHALRKLPAKRRPLIEDGTVDAALNGTPRPLSRTSLSRTSLSRTYVWPYQLHGSIGPSCSVADYRQDGLTVWSGTQNPHSLRADLAKLLTLDEGIITIQRMEASGCYGRNCADDVGADAALLSRAVGRPVRVQLSREQEHTWEPKGAAQLMDVDGGLDDDGHPTAYRFVSRYPSDNAPTLALLLTGVIAPGDIPFEMGDRTAVPPYRYPNRRIDCDDVPTLVRAAWLRGVSAMPNTFAHESYIDELASMANEDPIAYRQQYLDDARARSLIEAVVKRAAWVPRVANRDVSEQDGWYRGRGFAYAQYVHSKFPGFGAALAAWAVTLKVHRDSGRIVIERLLVAQDAGLMVNPAGVRHQVHGNVIQTLSRTLKEKVEFENGLPISREWGGYPILRFSELPEIDVLLMDRPDEAPLGVGESTSLPGAPAIANALFDATGVRFLRPPFTPEVVRQGLHSTQNQADMAESDA